VLELLLEQVGHGDENPANAYKHLKARLDALQAKSRHGERPEPPPVQSANTSASVAADRMRTVQRSICSMDAVATRCST
jgi:hypothetical protein